MPPHINTGATVGLVAATVVVAAAIAIYESPEVRAFAINTRRKIAVALHALGDEINPNSSQNDTELDAQPRFNRPEDAEGFYQSSGDAMLDGDPESRRRQREELMYWNQLRLEKEAKEEGSRLGQKRTPSFDDFLEEDKTAEKGTYIYKSGAQVHDDGGMTRRARGVQSAAFGAGAVLANPFGDEHHIDMEDVQQNRADADLMARSVASTDIYGVEDDRPSREFNDDNTTPLIDMSTPFNPDESQVYENAQSHTSFSNITSGIDAHPDAYEAIHAWANASDDIGHNSFYSPLPVSPEPAMSETSDLDHLSRGELTPTDSMSMADSSEAEGVAVERPRESDVTSESESVSEAGVSTPDTWTEVGSVVSDEEAIHA